MQCWYILLSLVLCLSLTGAPAPAAIDLSRDVVFTFQGDLATLESVQLNEQRVMYLSTCVTGGELDGYPGYSGLIGTVEMGSVIITLYKAFLQTLPEGTYTLTVTYAGGASDQATFTR